LDATGPVRVEKAFVIDSVDGQPARLVLDLIATDRDAFLRNFALDDRPRRSHSASKTEHDAKDTDPRPLIVLDPGHGGLDGATVYTLSETASDAESARLAEAENRADIIAGVDLSAEPNDVADILIDLAQRETKAFSASFARTLVRELKATSRLHKQPMKSAG